MSSKISVDPFIKCEIGDDLFELTHCPLVMPHGVIDI